jgi:hypothetical protein
MTATKEQIVAEAERRWEAEIGEREWSVVDYIIEVIREGWKPPEPVDPDVLAVRGVLALISNSQSIHNGYRDGRYDDDRSFQMALAAYKAGREQEQERAKVLLEIAAYKAGRAAR